MKISTDNQIRIALETIFPDQKAERIEFHSSSLFSLFRIRLSDGRNLAAKQIPNRKMAEAEESGLRILRSGGARVPDCYGLVHQKDFSFVFMDFIEEGRATESKEDIKTSLIALYSKSYEEFGFATDNFIGSLEQRNGFYSDFREFFWNARLAPQIQLGIRSGLLTQKDEYSCESLLDFAVEKWKLNAILPRLIHGDLWSGNILGTNGGKAYFVDPSVSYAHPEQDMGMLQLFGSPISLRDMEEILFETDIETNGNLKERIPFWQLYPLLVHLNIFGACYVGKVRQILSLYGY